MKGVQFGKPFFQSNIWKKNGIGDPLLLENFTTKREAIKCIRDFVKSYKLNDELDCYVSHFDEYEFSDYSFKV